MTKTFHEDHPHYRIHPGVMRCNQPWYEHAILSDEDTEFDCRRVSEAIVRRERREAKRIENALRTEEGRRFHGMAQC